MPSEAFALNLCHCQWNCNQYTCGFSHIASNYLNWLLIFPSTHGPNSWPKKFPKCIFERNWRPVQWKLFSNFIEVWEVSSVKALDLVTDQVYCLRNTLFNYPIFLSDLVKICFKIGWREFSKISWKFCWIV